MSGASRLEEVEAWKASKILVRRVYEITKQPPAKYDHGYCNQIRRASVSIMSNIAEGFGRSTDKEFARFLDIARGSTFETLSLLHVGFEIGYIDDVARDELMETSFKIIAMITSFSRYLRNHERPV